VPDEPFRVGIARLNHPPQRRGTPGVAWRPGPLLRRGEPSYFRRQRLRGPGLLPLAQPLSLIPEIRSQLDGEHVMAMLRMRFAAAVAFVTCILWLASAAATLATDDAHALNVNISLLYQSGKYAEAIPLAERALALSRERYGLDHLETARGMRWLAILYQVQGRDAEAEPLYKAALHITEKALGPDHPDVATLLQSLASLYRIRGLYSQAEALYKRALAIKATELGPDHPDIGTLLIGLARISEDQRRYTEAEALYKRALANWERAPESDNQDLGQALIGLADVYRAQRRYAARAGISS